MEQRGYLSVHWPAHIVECIVGYASASRATVGGMGEYGLVCRAWADIIRGCRARTVFLDGGSGGDAGSKACIPSTAFPHGRRAKRVIIKLPLCEIATGRAVNVWQQNGVVFENATHLDITITSQDHAAHRHKQADGLALDQFQQTLTTMLPRLAAVTTHDDALAPGYGSQVTSAVFQRLLDRLHQSKSKKNSPHLPASKRACFSRCTQFLLAASLPVFTGLTTIILDALVVDSEEAFSLVTRNSASLCKLDLVFHYHANSQHIMQDSQGRLFSYPRVEWLRMAVFGAGSFEHRSPCLAPNPFPKLRRLYLPGEYPFANNTLLGDKDGLLETLQLGVSAASLVVFQQTGLFTQKYPNLRHVELIDNLSRPGVCLPPLYVWNGPMGVGMAASLIEMALAFNTTTPNVTIDIGSMVGNARLPMLESARKIAAVQPLSIQTLDIADNTLTLQEVLELVRLVPSLKSVTYMVSMEADNAGCTVLPGAVAANRLEELVVRLKDGDNIMHGHTWFVEQCAEYACGATIGLGCLNRILFLADTSASLDRDTDRLQKHYAMLLAKYTTRQQQLPALVKFGSKHQKSDVFVHCRQQ